MQDMDEDLRRQLERENDESWATSEGNDLDQRGNENQEEDMDIESDSD